MLIPVIYSDDTRDMVESWTLSHLIREGRIKAFRRSNGWARIGIDLIRRFDCIGFERKGEGESHENNLLHLPETCL
jgi:hypothetical protein